MNAVYYGNELYHFGTKGQKWGIRNYQNLDGSYTAKGNHRYDPDTNSSKSGKNTHTTSKLTRSSNVSSKSENIKKRGFTDGQKTALKVGAGIVVAGLAAYGGYKLAKHIDAKNREAVMKILDNSDFAKQQAKSLHDVSKAAEHMIPKKNDASKLINNVAGKLDSVSNIREHYGIKVPKSVEVTKEDIVKYPEIVKDKKEGIELFSKYKTNPTSGYQFTNVKYDWDTLDKSQQTEEKFKELVNKHNRTKADEIKARINFARKDIRQAFK